MWGTEALKLIRLQRQLKWLYAHDESRASTVFGHVRTYIVTFALDRPVVAAVDWSAMSVVILYKYGSAKYARLSI